MLVKAHISSQRFSHTLLVKGILLHVLQWRSWRQAALSINVPYIVLYGFYKKIQGTNIEKEILLYMVERSIILYIDNERYITDEILKSTEVKNKSLERIYALF